MTERCLAWAFCAFVVVNFFCLTYSISFSPHLTLVLTLSVCLSLFNAVSIYVIVKSVGIVEGCVTVFPSLRVVCMNVWPIVFSFNLKFKTVFYTEILN